MNKAVKILMWIAIALLSLVLLTIVLLYMPFVQNWAKDFALSKIKESTGINISVKEFLLSFPVGVKLSDVEVVDAVGDTMVVVGWADIDVSLLPLLVGEVKITDAQVSDVRYAMGNRDSAMCLMACVDKAQMAGASLNIAKSLIDVDDVMVDGGRVSLLLNHDTTQVSNDSVTTVPWKINAVRVAIRNMEYRMAMQPVIDSLYAHIGDAVVDAAVIDMSQNHIDVSALSVDSLTAAYFTPKDVSESTTESSSETVSQSLPWTIEVSAIAVERSSAIYAVKDYEPANGLDIRCLRVDSIEISVDSFYNCGTEIKVPIKHLAATERCGVTINAKGFFAMDSESMSVKKFEVATSNSKLSVNAEMGMGDMVKDESLPLMLLVDGIVGVEDVALAYPMMKPLMGQLPPNKAVELEVDVRGVTGNLAINKVNVSLPRYATLGLDGVIRNVMNVEHIAGGLNMTGSLADVNFVKSAMLDANMVEQVDFPSMNIDGRVNLNGSRVDGNVEMIARNGRIALDAKWNGRGTKYDMTLVADSFPVDAFLPKMGVGLLGADVSLRGEGFDIMSPQTRFNADVKINQFEYKGRSYKQMRAWADMVDRRIEAGIVSLNQNADLDVEAIAQVNDDGVVDWTITGDVRHVDLAALKLSESRMAGSLGIGGSGTIDVKTNGYKAHLSISDLAWDMPGMTMATPQIDAKLNANDSLMKVNVKNRDLVFDFISLCSVDTFINRMTKAVEVLDSQIVKREFDVSGFQRELPRFTARLESGNDNVLSSILASNGMSMSNVSLSVDNDSLFNIQGDVLQLKIGDTRLDTVSVSALQHSRYLVYKATLDNAPGTLDGFAHVDINGYVASDKISMFADQKNIDGKQGFNLGAITSIGDSVVNVKLVPLTPMIGYKQWTVNKDNYVDYNFYTHHVDANVQLIGQNSHLKLYTEHVDGAHSHQEDVVLDIYNLQLAEVMKVSPYAPPVKGGLSADMRFRWDESSISGNGTMSLDEMYIGRDRVGTFDLGVDLSTDKTGQIKAQASLMVDDIKTITVAGVLNDTISSNPMSLNFSMVRFPLRVLNPFLPRKTASIRGMLNGEMAVTGELSSPRFDGYISFDTTTVKIDMIGSSFVFSDEKVPVNKNVVSFNNYKIWGANENALTINGVVDMGDFISPVIDLSMKARNIQFLNSNKGKGTDVYGKGFANLDATVNGDMSLLNVDAKLNLLGGSNITYIMADASTAIASQSTGNMVKFVQFSDTASIAEVDTVALSSMALNLDAQLTVSGGTTINVDLSADGKNRVQLQGSGSLNYTMNNTDDSRFTGRYTIDKGFVRYTPPLMSEKLFNFKEGSYVAFNGDMLNPILNIHADDVIKANVTREGQDSRLVNFDVSLAVTNTLSNMDVAFDLSTNEDISIQKELQSMSAEQRANQAMNMLLYNVYTGPGTKTDISGNPLYSFLESQINSWAANNIKFVDVSFGIDQYDKTQGGTTSTTTSYSYKVSKTLFNDRFKIVIGGNYSTDAETDEDIAQNLINDISFEYMLNRSGSMYIKVFRHVGYESILEGEVTQTGVGFVYKRKLHTLKDLFRKGRRKSEKAEVHEKEMIKQEKR